MPRATTDPVIFICSTINVDCSVVSVFPSTLSYQISDWEVASQSQSFNSAVESAQMVWALCIQRYVTPLKALQTMHAQLQQHPRRRIIAHVLSMVGSERTNLESMVNAKTPTKNRRKIASLPTQERLSETPMQMFYVECKKVVYTAN